MMFYDSMDSPVGTIHLIANKNGLQNLSIGEEYQLKGGEKLQVNAKEMAEYKKQLNEYFLKQRQVFDLPLAPKGTPFQQQVWQALRAIPCGQTRTYAEIAKAIGNPKAYRAVGMANNKNPIPLIIPCHRVIGSNGKLTGFAYGLDMKAKLLAIEQGA